MMMNAKSYSELAHIYMKKALRESTSTNVIPRIAAEYFNKAAGFFLMDKKQLSTAASYEDAAYWYLEDGDVDQCCINLRYAAQCHVRFNTTNGIIQDEPEISRLFIRAATLREDSMEYFKSANIHEELAVYYEKNKEYERAYSSYMNAVTLFKKDGYPWSVEKCEKKAKEMLNLFNEKK